MRLWIFLPAILIPACGASLQFIVIHPVKGFGVVNKAEAQGFPCGSAGKESTCNGGDLGWEDPLKKGKATHSSVLAWRIPPTV